MTMRMEIGITGKFIVKRERIRWSSWRNSPAKAGMNMQRRSSSVEEKR